MSLGYLPTPCDIHVFFTLSHGDSLQTPFDLSFPTPSPPLEMDTVSLLRHTHATELIRSGMDAAYVQRW
jgi:hypothetical protein